MPSVTYLIPDGSSRTLDLRVGQSVMEGAIHNGLRGILAECGGAAACATCHVYVEKGPVVALPPLSRTEDAMLDGTVDDRLPNSRLSCQIRMTAELDGLVVRIAELM